MKKTLFITCSLLFFIFSTATHAKGNCSKGQKKISCSKIKSSKRSSFCWKGKISTKKKASICRAKNKKKLKKVMSKHKSHKKKKMQKMHKKMKTKKVMVKKNSPKKVIPTPVPQATPKAAPVMEKEDSGDEIENESMDSEENEEISE